MKHETFGFNEVFVESAEMIKAGCVDPAKVMCAYLQTAMNFERYRVRLKRASCLCYRAVAIQV